MHDNEAWLTPQTKPSLQLRTGSGKGNKTVTNAVRPSA